ncbi:MAG: sigma-70 family RNA polymerase sigma factor [Verrucomicrobia bacterium]|nr:sigma-70 family RNA polymerase sigma factor [Verrucomicrobiota bacterium]
MKSQQTSTDPNQWVEDFGDYLYRYALLRLRDPSIAQDAVQETFLAAVKGLDRYDGRVGIKYWLRGILRNKIVDHFRKSVREDIVEDPEAKQMAESFWFKYSGIPTRNPQPWQFDPHQAFDKKEFWSIFETCLGKLDTPLRQAFVMKMLEGIETSEICKVLNVSANNYWVMMHRARTKLKTCLERNWATTQ